MTGIALIDPGDEFLIEVDWNNILIPGIALAGDVIHTVPSPLVKVSEVTEAASGLSQVKVRGAQHGALYMIEAQATLTNTEIVNRQFPVRCFNG